MRIITAGAMSGSDAGGGSACCATGGQAVAGLAYGNCDVGVSGVRRLRARALLGLTSSEGDPRAADVDKGFKLNDLETRGKPSTVLYARTARRDQIIYM